MGQSRAARDAELGAALVCPLGAAARGALALAPAARERARAGRVSDRRVGAGLDAAVERDRLSPGEDASRTPAPALRQGAAQLAARRVADGTLCALMKASGARRRRIARRLGKLKWLLWRARQPDAARRLLL